MVEKCLLLVYRLFKNSKKFDVHQGQMSQNFKRSHKDNQVVRRDMSLILHPGDFYFHEEQIIATLFDICRFYVDMVGAVLSFYVGEIRQ